MSGEPWRYYRIYPENRVAESEWFYAPGVLIAFELARAKWPTAGSWYCIQISEKEPAKA